MKALILNSGLGHRMGGITKVHPKCMTEITEKDTILSRQLNLLNRVGIKDVIITTGYFGDVLINYCKSLSLPINIIYVNNPLFAETNYIYSIYCAKSLLEDDILLMHGDLVFEESVLKEMLEEESSCMKVSSTIALPEKDFKAVIRDGEVKAVGIEFFDSAMEAQAFYKLNEGDWKIWLNKISEYCESGKRNCYAEVALNEVTDSCHIKSYDVKDRLCTEIDNPEDLEKVRNRLKAFI